MNYLLTVLSSGRSDYLRRTLAAFTEHVWPSPTSVYIYDDGQTIPPAEFVKLVGLLDCEVVPTWASARDRLGMCAAHARCWERAARSDLEWVFHLEDDHLILCPIDLGRIAAVMEQYTHLAQMTLLRGPVGAEVPHGGYIEQEPGWYERRLDDNLDHLEIGYEARWFETRRNWACAPTLFRTNLAREFPWPAEPGCETTIGPRILDAHPDWRFGIWGGGEIHVAHIGVERAPGAHGY